MGTPTIIQAVNRHGINWQRSLTCSGNVIAEVLSAVIKEIRRGKEENALYWALEMAQCGRIPEKFLWECLVVCSVEDIGLANPTVLLSVRSARDEYLALPHKDKRRFIFLAFAVSALSRSRKSRYVTELSMDVQARMEAGELKLKIPDYAIDVHTKRGRDLGRGLPHYLTQGAFLENADESFSGVYRRRLLERAK